MGSKIETHSVQETQNMRNLRILFGKLSKRLLSDGVQNLDSFCTVHALSTKP